MREHQYTNNLNHEVQGTKLEGRWGKDECWGGVYGLSTNYKNNE